MDDSILKPLDAFESLYKQKFHDAAEADFASLVKKSGIDAGKNRATVKSYHSEKDEADKLGKKLVSLKSLKAFCIIIAVVGIVLAIVGIYILATGGRVAVGASLLPVGIVLAIAMFLIVFLILKKRIASLEEDKNLHEQRANAYLKQCWEQMSPLNALFDSGVTKRLIERTVPLIKIDDNFGMHRYDYLSSKYGFGENLSTNHSTIGILTGEILGNPFVVDREVICSMGTCTYTGTLTIHWTTTYRDSEGHTHTQHHTQVLVATVNKPKPVYNQRTRLIYGNEAAPDLIFTHEPTHAEQYTDKKLESVVKSGAKKLQKQHEKAIKKGENNFTSMGNEEFDVLFNADDRNNEVQFRLLFTPLAQQNMLALMKDKKNYGDDFGFAKRRCLNYISSEHSRHWDLDTDYKRYMSYDIDLAKKSFMSFNEAYFKSLYFDLAPLLSIPMYQQHKPHEYIYQEVYGRNYTPYEAEYIANRMGQSTFAGPDFATDSILKTSLLEKDGNSDKVRVTAYSHKGEPRVDFVPTLGGDGHIHAVPVPWTEYIPISRDSTVNLKALDITDRQFEEGHIGLKDVINSLCPNSVFSHGILGSLLGDGNISIDSQIDNVLK